jgi:hypothetical protein
VRSSEKKASRAEAREATPRTRPAGKITDYTCSA